MIHRVKRPTALEQVFALSNKERLQDRAKALREALIYVGQGPGRSRENSEYTRLFRGLFRCLTGDKNSRRRATEHYIQTVPLGLPEELEQTSTILRFRAIHEVRQNSF